MVQRYAYALVYLANTPDESEDEVERRGVGVPQHLNLLRQQQIDRPYGLFGTARLVVVEYPKYENTLKEQDLHFPGQNAGVQLQ